MVIFYFFTVTLEINSKHDWYLPPVIPLIKMLLLIIAIIYLTKISIFMCQTVYFSQYAIYVFRVSIFFFQINISFFFFVLFFFFFAVLGTFVLFLHSSNFLRVKKKKLFRRMIFINLSRPSTDRRIIIQHVALIIIYILLSFVIK